MKSYILAALAITPLFLTTLADGTSTIKHGYKSIPPTGSVAVLNHGPMRPADWRDHLSDWNTVSKRDAEPAKANLHDPANWRKPASPPGKSVSKRGEWEDEYNYAVTWAGTETAGQYQATHTGRESVDFYGMPVSKRAEASGGPGGSGNGQSQSDGMAGGNGQAQGSGQAQGDDQSQGKHQQGGKGDGGEEQHQGNGQGQGQGQGQKQQHEAGPPADGPGNGHAMASGMPPKQGEGH